MDTPVRSVRGVTGWPARGLRRLYHILMGAPKLERAEPRPATGAAQEGVRRPWWRRVFGGVSRATCVGEATLLRHLRENNE
jgi:hypothetical protein